MPSPVRHPLDREDVLALAGLSGIAASRGRAGGFSLLSAGNLLVAALTYARQAEIARLFGTTGQTDAYAIAIIIPILAQQVISHAFGATFLPVYTSVLHRRGLQAARALVGRLLGWTAAAGAALTALLLLLSARLVPLVGPGLPADMQNLSSSMLEWLLPVILLSASSGILNGILNSQTRFGVVSLSTVAGAAVSLLSVILLHGRLGIMSLPLSGTAGAAASFAVSLAGAARFGPGLSMRLDARDEDFRDLLRMSVPVVIGVLIGLLGPSVDKLLASLLPASSVTALDYAQRVRDIALGLLFTPIVSLADVGLSRASARGDLTEFRREMSTLLSWTSFLMLPTAAALTCLASPVVGVLFMRGSFTPASVAAVGAALVFYAPWLAQFGFGAVVSRGFYALRDSRTPVLIGIWGIAANICLSIILIGPLGVGGIALASTASSTAKTILLTWFMRRRTGGPGLPGTAAEQGRILLATAGMTAVLLAVQEILPAGLDEPLSTRLPALAAWIASGLSAYLGLLVLLRSTTAGTAVSRIADLLSRRRGGGGR